MGTKLVSLIVHIRLIFILQVLNDDLDREAVAAGRLTPMFFGSAMTNFGVETFLRTFIDEAAPPGEQATRSGKELEPTSTNFTGLVFKLQARYVYR